MHVRSNLSPLSLAALTLVFTAGIAWSSGISVTSPVSTDTYHPGDTVTVTWEAESVPTEAPVYILLVRGSEYAQGLEEGYNVEGTARFRIMDMVPVDNQYRIKVMLQADSSVYGYSELFSITARPWITITSPEESESFSMSEAVSITWESGGEVGEKVRIELLSNGTYRTTISSSTDNDGDYRWVPLEEYEESHKYQIRIWGTQGEAVVGTGDRFTLYPKGPIQNHLHVHVEPSLVRNNEPVAVTWESKPPAFRFKVDLYQSGNHVMTIADGIPTPDTVVWIPKDLTIGTGYEVRVFSFCEGRPIYYGSAYLRAEEKYGSYVTVSASGDTVMPGTSVSVQWPVDLYDTSSVILFLYDEDHVFSSRVVPNTGNAEFPVSHGAPDSERYRLVVRAGHVRHSSEYFTVADLSRFRFTAPAPGTSVQSGDSCRFTWNITDYQGENARLEYRTIPGKKWTRIDNVSVSKGEYVWHVRKMLNTVDCVVRIGSLYRAGKCDSVRIRILANKALEAHCADAHYADGAVRLSWNWIPDTRFEVNLATDEDLSHLIMTASVEDSTCSIPIDLEPGVYFWRVSIPGTQIAGDVCRLGTMGGGVPIPVAVRPDPTNDRRTPLRWHPVEGAKHYRLLVATDDTFGSPLVAIPVADTVFRTNVAFPEGKIYWKVKSDLSNAYSSVQSFTILPDSIPMLVRFNGEKISTRRPGFRWHSVPGANEYRIQVYSEAGQESNEPSLVINTGDTSFTPLTDLEPGPYFWRVSCDRDISLYSPRDRLVVLDGSPVTHGQSRPRFTSVNAITAPGRAPVLEYSTVRGGTVSFRLFDARGNLLHASATTHSRSGVYQVPLNTRALAAGMYLCIVRIDGKKMQRRVIVAQ